MLKDNERLDLIQASGYGIIQNKKWFSYGIDAVLVSHFAEVKSTDVVVDFGTGNGIIPLLIHLNHQPKKIIGIEKQCDVAEMAVRSVAYNKIDSIQILNIDIQDTLQHIKKSSVDVVISNPPYFKKGGALINSGSNKAQARHETTAVLDDFVATAAQVLRPMGTFFMVHRPSRLVDILVAGRQYGLEPKLVQFVQPSQDKLPNIVLVKFVKNGKAELYYKENLYVYDQNRAYTDQIKEIYKNMHIDVF